MLGKSDTRQGALLHPALCAPSLMAAAARAVPVPVLYHVQWDEQFELFDALASADKYLVARPGSHSQTYPDDEASWQEFLVRNTSHASWQ